MGSHSVQRASTVSVTVLSNDCRKVVAEAVGGLGLAVGCRLSSGPFLRSATYPRYELSLPLTGRLPLSRGPTIAPILGHSTRLRPSLRARPTSLALLGAAAALRPPARVRRPQLTRRRLPAYAPTCRHACAHSSRRETLSLNLFPLVRAEIMSVTEFRTFATPSRESDETDIRTFAMPSHDDQAPDQHSKVQKRALRSRRRGQISPVQSCRSAMTVRVNGWVSPSTRRVSSRVCWYSAIARSRSPACR